MHDPGCGGGGGVSLPKSSLHLCPLPSFQVCIGDYHLHHFYWGLWLPTSTPEPSARKGLRFLNLGGYPWTPESEFCGMSWGGGLTVTFSASLASRMYLSRTRLSQMRRGGAPRTGRPRGSSSKDSRSSRAGHSRKECQTECVGLEGPVHTFRSSAPSEALPTPTFPALRFCLLCLHSIPLPSAHPTPSNYRHPLLPAKLQSLCDRGFPSRRSR